MPQMMSDILQYVPYAILVAAVFLLLGGGVVYTILFFRKAGKRVAN